MDFFGAHTAPTLTLHDGVIAAAVKEESGIITIVNVVVLDRHAIAPLGGDDAVVAVAPDLVIVDVEVVTVVVGVKPVFDVVVHIISPPVTLLVACGGEAWLQPVSTSGISGALANI